VVDDLAVLHGGRERLRIEDRGLLQVDLPGCVGEVPERAGREVVDDRDFVSGAEPIDEMGTDEARAPGD